MTCMTSTKKTHYIQKHKTNFSPFLILVIKKKCLIPRLIILKSNRDYVKETNTHNKDRTTSHVIQYKKLIADFNLELECLSLSSRK